MIILTNLDNNTEDKELSFELARVELPTFPDQAFPIVDFGAIGDGTVMNTKAFADAIAACAEAGGGTVTVPAGIWRTGPIGLRSHVNLHVERGALVLFSGSFDNYPLVRTNYEGKETIRCTSPIYGELLENIAITGDGVFDGSGGAWRPVKKFKTTEPQWRKLQQSGGVVDAAGSLWWPTEAAMNGEARLRQLLAEGTQSVEAFRDVRDYLRPNLLSLTGCRRVLLDGPTFQNSPAWCLHPRLCEQVTIRRVTVRNPWFAQNGDGLDLDSCRYVEVSDSVFDVGDDAICLKSGKNEEGRKLGKPCEYISVRGCRVFHGHGGFVIGSEMSGGVRNVRVSDCTFIGTDTGLRFKSTRGRGGVVENIDIRDIRMTDIGDEAITFDMYYGKPAQREGTETEAVPPVTEGTPCFRRIRIRDTTCVGARSALRLRGLPEMPIGPVTLERVAISADRGAEITDGEDIRLSGVRLQVREGPIYSLHNARVLQSDEVAGPDAVFGASD